MGRVDPELLWIVRTTSLLESRSDQYTAYLRAVLPEEMHDAIAAWGKEESHHGRALRRWLQLADPDWDFDKAFAAFTRVAYHHDEAVPRRGGQQHELVSRCVIEALASGFYVGLARRASEPLLRQICERLIDDERRHLRLFSELRDALPALGRAARLRVAFQRIRELGDDQIVYAAQCASGIDQEYVRRNVRRRYFGRVRRLHGVCSTTYTLWLLTEAVVSGGRRAESPRPTWSRTRPSFRPARTGS